VQDQTLAESQFEKCVESRPDTTVHDKATLFANGKGPPMDRYPTSDESVARLHRAGWSVGELAVIGAAARVWIVSGSCGENQVDAHGRTQGEAWDVAWEMFETAQPRWLAI
jgi:hypothetical protein